MRTDTRRKIGAFLISVLVAVSIGTAGVLTSRRTTLPKTPNQNPPPAQAPTNRSILISAILFNNGQVELPPWYILEKAERDIDLMPTGSDFFLEYLDNSGQVIYSKGFADLFDYDGQHLDIAPLSFTAPYTQGLKEIRLKRGSQTIFSRSVSPHGPEVGITSPEENAVLSDQVLIEWYTRDKDGDKIFSSLTAYGEGEGDIWPLADDLEARSFIWKTSDIPPGPYRLEVLVSDNVNTSRTEVRVVKK